MQWTVNPMGLTSFEFTVLFLTSAAPASEAVKPGSKGEGLLSVA